MNNETLVEALVSEPENDNSWEKERKEEYLRKLNIILENGYSIRKIELPEGIKKYLDLSISWEHRRYGDEVIFFEGISRHHVEEQISNFYNRVAYSKGLDTEDSYSLKEDNNLRDEFIKALEDKIKDK